MRLFLIATLFALTMGLARTASGNSCGVLGVDFWDPLLYRDLVIRGTVGGSRIETVNHDDWTGFDAGGTRTTVMAKMVVMQVDEVLKGHYESGTITIGVTPELPMLPGQQYVCCLRHNKNFGGGTFQVWGGEDVFLLSADGLWVHLSDNESVTLDEIRAKTESVKIENVIKEAEVIVAGTVVDTTQSRVVGDDGSLGTLLECTVKIDSLIKGEVPADTISFKMIVGGTYSPKWRTHSPTKLERGERWYVFLKKGEIGYYPFAGSNGLFKIVGDALIYDLRIECPFTRSELDQLAKRRAGK